MPANASSHKSFPVFDLRRPRFKVEPVVIAVFSVSLPLGLLLEHDARQALLQPSQDLLQQ